MWITDTGRTQQTHRIAGLTPQRELGMLPYRMIVLVSTSGFIAGAAAYDEMLAEPEL